MKSTKKRLISSVLALIMCVCMLIGTTFAWFTDSVTSGKNRIVAGNLDVEVTHTNAYIKSPASIQGEDAMFVDKNGNEILWEPGVVSFENLTIANVGNLVFKYKINMNVSDYNMVKGTGDNLTQAIKVMVLTGDDMLTGDITREDVLDLDWANADTIEDFQKDDGVLYPAVSGNSSVSEDSFQLIAYWEPTDNDNRWNLNNGKHNTDGFKVDGEEALFIEFGINVFATQKDFEKDSFDEKYDVLNLPNFPKSINKVFETSDIQTKIDESGTITAMTVDGESLGDESVRVVNKSNNTGVGTITRASVNSVVSALVGKANVENIDITSDQNSIIYIDIKTTQEPSETGAEYDITLSAKMDYVDKTTNLATTAEINHLTEEDLGGEIAVVTLDLGKGLQNVKVAHAGTPMTKLDKVDANQEGFFYNSDTGVLTIKSKSFSPFQVTYSAPFEYVAMNKVTDKYYLDAELAFNEADPLTDTIVILKDCSIDADKIPAEVNFDLNGKTLNTESKRTVVVPATGSADAKYVKVSLWGYSNLLDADYNPIENGYALLDGTTVYYFVYNGSWYYSTFDEGDKQWADQGYKSYYASDIIDIPSQRTVSGKFYGNTTALKYFESGFGTAESPFILSSAAQLQNMDALFTLAKAGATDAANNPEFVKFAEDTTYYEVSNNIDVSGLYTNSGNYIYTNYAYQKIDLNLNNKAISNINSNLFGYLCNANIHDGIFNFNANTFATITNSVFDDFANSKVSFENLVLTGNINAVTVNNTHYGPLVAFCYGINENNVDLEAKNVTNQMTMKLGSGDYVGGLFGYVQGSKVMLSITDCAFGGSLESTHVGGFVGGCTNPGRGVVQSGNSLDATILGTESAHEFGMSTQTVEKSENTIIMVLSPTHGLVNFDTANYGDQFTINHTNENVVHYEVVLSYNVYHLSSLAGGFGRYIRNTVDVSQPGTYDSGIYKYYLVQADAANEGKALWTTGNTYNFFEYGVGLHECNLTVSVFGYDSNNNIVTYEVGSYANNP